MGCGCPRGEKTCHTCKGSGHSNGVCPTCKGIGTIPYDYGKDVVNKTPMFKEGAANISRE